MKVVRLQYDVLVVGSGGSGSAAASAASKRGARVLVISKDPIVASDSKIAEGIVTVRDSADNGDSTQELNDNMRVQGDDLADATLTSAFSEQSRSAYGWLQAQGLKANIDENTGKPIPLSIPMGGHSKARSVDHPNGGLDYAHACWNALQNGSIDYLEDAWLLDLYSREKMGVRSVLGGLVYHASEGHFISVYAPKVILACGGLSTIYFPHTDTMKGNTGDAYAIAARAGAQMVDMEQVQFIPFAVAHPPSFQGLVVGEPIMAGILGVLRDGNGKVILSQIMGRTRAECAAAIAKAVAKGKGTEHGGCYLDLTENGLGEAGDSYTALMKEKIPGILDVVKNAMGTEAAKFKQPWEVKPSAHYLMGGIRVNGVGQAYAAAKESVATEEDDLYRGLYAVGQAMGGLHGSNRLGSTSLAEAVIFGRLAGEHAASRLDEKNHHALSATWHQEESRLVSLFVNAMGNNGTYHPIHLIRRLQDACWNSIGPARNGDQLARFEDQLDELEGQMYNVTVGSADVWNQSLIDWVELRNMHLCARLVGVSASQRSSSLGAHLRTDSKSEGLLKRRYSLVSFVDPNNPSAIASQHIYRERSSMVARTKVAVEKHAKITVFKSLGLLPQSMRDKVIGRIYEKARGSKSDSQEHNAMVMEVSQ